MNGLKFHEETAKRMLDYMALENLIAAKSALDKSQIVSNMTVFDGKELRVITPEESREHFSVMIKEEKHNEKVMQEVKWRFRARGFKVT